MAELKVELKVEPNESFRSFLLALDGDVEEILIELGLGSLRIDLEGVRLRWRRCRQQVGQRDRHAVTGAHAQHQRARTLVRSQSDMARHAFVSYGRTWDDASLRAYLPELDELVSCRDR